MNDFIIAAGYLGNILFEYILNLKTDWNIKVLDTGLNTQTGGRIKQCIESDDSDRFYVTYGDGLGNINLKLLTRHHLALGKTATVTCVRPPARFGVLEKSGGIVTNFGEKRQSDVGWINGGYFVLERKIVDVIPGNESSFEMDVMPKLALDRSLAAFEHEGFWQPMDTLRERNLLAEFATKSPPPWLVKLA